MDRIRLYTDGSCPFKNPGRGGWAFVAINEITRTETMDYGGYKVTTNNRMELMAVIKGLKTIKNPSNIDVYSDSTYVCNGINKWLNAWSKKRSEVANWDLWCQIYAMKEIHNLRAIWVRSHSGDHYNEQCDKAAYSGAMQEDRAADRGYVPDKTKKPVRKKKVVFYRTPF